jgi:heterodisulfide reductase subunit C
VTQTRKSALATQVAKSTGVDVTECYQCGKCTAGCPMADHMDLSPNQVMLLVQIGDEEAVEALLGSETIWACAGCLTCTQRCPRKLDPAAVMDVLREMSNRQGKVSAKASKILAFHKAFLKSVESGGRMAEFPLTRRYKMATMDLFSDVSLAPKMMIRGKLHMISPKVRGRKEIRRIFAACREGRR